MDQQNRENVFKRYQEGILSDMEQAKLETWYARFIADSDEEPDWVEMERRLGIIATRLPGTHSHSQKQAAVSRPIRQLWTRYVAAVLALFVLVGGYFFLEMSSDERSKKQESRVAQLDISPGSNRATLTLADGSTVELSDAYAGIIMNEGDVSYQDGSFIVASKDEGIDFQKDYVNTSAAMSISTPKGGTYRITLSDGSKVWLNAASTLKYPATFEDLDRIVELEGEAYFDVAKGQGGHSSFKVLTKGQVVEVHGTQFNVSAYSDDLAIKTTLVEGEVSVRSDGEQRMLRLAPGEQAILIHGMLTKQHVDISNDIAWTKGYFKFSDDLETILKQIGRWYDAEIIYEDEQLKRQRIFGIVYRNKTLNEALNIISLACEARFETEPYYEKNLNKGRRIIVMPK